MSNNDKYLFHSTLKVLFEKQKTDNVSSELTNCNDEIAKLRNEISSLKVRSFANMEHETINVLN